MKKLLLAVLLCAGVCGAAFAQGFQVPDYEFKTAEDYAKYDQAIVGAYEWLMKTPVGEYQERYDVYKFLLEWSQGTPDFMIEIGDPAMNASGEDVHLFAIYLAGYSAYLINAKESGKLISEDGDSVEDKDDAIYAAVKDMIQLYKSNRTFYKEKNKVLEKYIKLDAKGGLKKMIEDSRPPVPAS